MDQAVDKQTMAADATPLTESEKNAIIGGVLLSMLLAALDQTIIAPAMPTIARAPGHELPLRVFQLARKHGQHRPKIIDHHLQALIER